MSFSSNLLSVSTLESRATSNSSSSSSSSSTFGSDLQASDSQTDYSPPHSPKKDTLRYTEPLVKSFLDHTTHLDRGTITPKQSPHIPDNGWLQTDDDMGYDSEHESSPNNPTKYRPRLLTRKRVASSRHLIKENDLCIGADTSPQTRITVEASPHVQNCQGPPPGTRSNVAESDKTCIRGLGLDVLSSDKLIGATTVISTSVSSHSSRSPLPTAEVSHPHISSSCIVPRKPRLEPIDIPDDMSPIESLPPLLGLANLKDSIQGAPLSGFTFGDNGTTEDTELEGPHRVQTSDPGRPSAASDVVSAPIHEDVTGGNKPAPELGLGLPSGLVSHPSVQKTPHRRVQTPIQTTQPNPHHKKKICSKEYRYPRRRLYNICESSSSRWVSFRRKLHSISYPGAIDWGRSTVSNNRRSSLPLVLDAECLYGPTFTLLDMVHSHKAKAKRGNNARARLPVQKGSFPRSLTSMHQSGSSLGRPRPTYDTVAPWANTQGPKRPRLQIRLGPYSSSALPAGNKISPVIIHIGMPKNLHFANHRHYRTEHTLF